MCGAVLGATQNSRRYHPYYKHATRDKSINTEISSLFLAFKQNNQEQFNSGIWLMNLTSIVQW